MTLAVLCSGMEHKQPNMLALTGDATEATNLMPRSHLTRRTRPTRNGSNRCRRHSASEPRRTNSLYVPCNCLVSRVLKLGLVGLRRNAISSAAGINSCASCRCFGPFRARLEGRPLARPRNNMLAVPARSHPLVPDIGDADRRYPWLFGPTDAAAGDLHVDEIRPAFHGVRPRSCQRLAKLRGTLH